MRRPFFHRMTFIQARKGRVRYTSLKPSVVRKGCQIQRSRGREVGGEKEKVARAVSPGLRLLGSTTTASRSASATGVESTSTLATHVSTPTRSTTREAASTELLVRALATLFNLELDIVDGVGIGGNGSLVSCGSLEVNECAVLQHVSVM
jgi:hypothetical protein